MSEPVMVGIVVAGSLLLSVVALANGVSPLWTIPPGVAIGVWNTHRNVRRRLWDVTAKPCPGCRRLPLMLCGRDEGERIHITVACRTNSCPVTGGVEIQGQLIPGTPEDHATALHYAQRRAGAVWSGDDMMTTLRQQARRKTNA